MSVKAFIGGILAGLRSSASVSTVYGKPIHALGKTLIPVAKVAYGFGGGGETEKKGTFGKRNIEKEEGGGGGVAVKPIGVLEVTGKRTRFVPVSKKARLFGILAIGFVTGLVWSRRKITLASEKAGTRKAPLLGFARGHR